MLEILKSLLEDQRKILKLYALGALLFFVGIGFIQSADKFMEPSVQQEGYVLLGVIVCGAGFFMSMFSQCLLIAYRFSLMGKKPTAAEKDSKD